MLCVCNNLQGPTQTHQQLGEQVIFSKWRVECLCFDYGHCVQEQSTRRKVDDLERQLRSSEALVAHLQDTLQQRNSELETLRSKVSHT